MKKVADLKQNKVDVLPLQPKESQQNEDKSQITLLQKIKNERTKELFDDSDTGKTKNFNGITELLTSGKYNGVRNDDVKVAIKGRQRKRRDSSPVPPPTPSSAGNVSPWDFEPTEDYESDMEDSSIANSDVSEGEDTWWNASAPQLSNIDMLRNAVKCDLTILLNKTEDTVLAHSYVLSSRSELLAVPLTKQAEQKSKRLRILDIDTKAFLLLLRYFYTDHLEFSSVNEAIAILPVIRRCGPLYLIERVFDYISNNITLKNAVTIAEISHEYKCKRASSKAINFITHNASQMLPDTSFTRLCLHCVERVVKSEDIYASEMTIYFALQSWAAQECVRLHLTPTTENLRQVLGAVLYCVRFPVINFQLINRDFNIFKALSEDERKTLYKYHTGKVQILPHYFNNTHRKFHELNRQIPPSIDTPPLSRATGTSETSSEACKTPSTTSSKSSAAWSYMSGESVEREPIFNKVMRFKRMSGPWTMRAPETLSFKASRTIILGGIMMFASYGTDEALKVEVTVNKGDEILFQQKSAVKSSDKKPKELFFKDTVTISPNVTYVIRVSVETKPTYLGVDGVRHVEVNATKFTFIDKGNDISRGQIPGLLFRNLLNDEIKT